MEKIKISYTQLPLKPLDNNIKTYSSELTMDVTLENTDLAELTKRYLKLEGYEQVETGGDVEINAQFGDFVLNKELITDDVFNANEGKNMTGYYYKIGIDYPVTLSIKTSGGDIVFEESIEHDQKLVHDDIGKWSYSNSQLDSKYNAEIEELKSDIKNKCDKKALAEIKDLLTSNFSYADINTKIKVASGKGKKLDYSDLESAILNMEKTFELISNQSDQESIDAEINKAIIIWQDALKESSDNKKSRINESITTMLYYNIGIGKWWMLDFQSAYEYMDKALQRNSESAKPSKSDEKLILEMKEIIEDYEQRLKIHDKL